MDIIANRWIYRIVPGFSSSIAVSEQTFGFDCLIHLTSGPTVWLVIFEEFAVTEAFMSLILVRRLLLSQYDNGFAATGSLSSLRGFTIATLATRKSLAAPMSP